MAAKKYKPTADYIKQAFDVVEAPKEKSDEMGAMPWASITRLADAGLGVERKTVEGREKVPAGRVWFRCGGSKDGSLNGRTILYQQGA